MNPALPKKDWYYVYLLGSSETAWIYIGCTNNLEKRLKTHNEGKVFSTRKRVPLEVLYYEAFREKHYAVQREKNLKAHGSGLAKLKSRLGIKALGKEGKGRAG